MITIHRVQVASDIVLFDRFYYFFDWYIQLRVGTNMEHSSNMLVVKVEKYNLFITGIELGKELKWGPNEVAYLWVQNRWKAYIN